MHTKTFVIDGAEWRIHHNSDWSGMAEVIGPGELLTALVIDIAEEMNELLRAPRAPRLLRDHRAPRRCAAGR